MNPLHVRGNTVNTVLESDGTLSIIIARMKVFEVSLFISGIPWATSFDWINHGETCITQAEVAAKPVKVSISVHSCRKAVLAKIGIDHGRVVSPLLRGRESLAMRFWWCEWSFSCLRCSYNYSGLLLMNVPGERSLYRRSEPRISYHRLEVLFLDPTTAVLAKRLNRRIWTWPLFWGRQLKKKHWGRHVCRMTSVYRPGVLELKEKCRRQKTVI